MTLKTKIIHYPISRSGIVGNANEIKASLGWFFWGGKFYKNGRPISGAQLLFFGLYKLS